MSLSHTETATIASGASLSGLVYLWPTKAAAFIMPSTWTAAALSFQGSLDGQTFTDVYNDAGDEYTIPATASQSIVLDAPLPFPYIKIRSGLTGAPVAQGAARSITVICHAGDRR